MVNLAKIRKKAKESKEKAAAEAPSIQSEPRGVAPPTPAAPPAQSAAEVLSTSLGAGSGATPDMTAQISRLERFKQEAGKRRETKRVAVDDTSPDDELEALTFIVAGEHYAVDIEKIVEIVRPRPITRVPNADPFIVGIISLRGAVVTLVDLHSRLHHPRAMEESEDRRIVVVNQDGEILGFEVDRVLRVVSVERARIEPQPVAHAVEQDESVQGVFRLPNSLTILLDLDKLMRAVSTLPVS